MVARSLRVLNNLNTAPSRLTCIKGRRFRLRVVRFLAQRRHHCRILPYLFMFGSIRHDCPLKLGKLQLRRLQLGGSPEVSTL